MIEWHSECTAALKFDGWEFDFSEAGCIHIGYHIYTDGEGKVSNLNKGVYRWLIFVKSHV